MNPDRLPSSLHTRRESQLLAVLIAHSARVPFARLKTCLSLFEIPTGSIRSTKQMVDRIVSLGLNAACEFKRAGFLEGEAIGTSLPIAQFTGASISPTRQWVCLFRTFKKIAPFELIRSVRLKADTESGRLFCLIR